MLERTLPDGTLAPAEEGWIEEQRVEAARLIKAERQAAQVVSAREFWKTLETGDIVESRTAPQYLEPVGAWLLPPGHDRPGAGPFRTGSRSGRAGSSA